MYIAVMAAKHEPVVFKDESMDSKWLIVIVILHAEGSTDGHH